MPSYKDTQYFAASSALLVFFIVSKYYCGNPYIVVNGNIVVVD